MKKAFVAAALLTALALPAAAQNWSLGARTGAFVFGDFIERKLRQPGVPPSGGAVTTSTLSAKTRPGLSVDLERVLGSRWAFRAEGTFTHAPLAIKSEGSSSGTELEAGDLDVTTLAVPIVFRINRNGAFRFHLLAGPAYAMYRINGRAPAGAPVNVSDETRSEWGAMAGLGLGWQLSNRFALEGEISDTVTTSPFREDVPDDIPGFKVPTPHNVHTTVGIRYRF
ncbi:MAG TPA: outer membrane beta-barrel protein [Thermoanaerobaculia bacterium]|jgi:opacity protein-like surface antigen